MGPDITFFIPLFVFVGFLVTCILIFACCQCHRRSQYHQHHHHSPLLQVRTAPPAQAGWDDVPAPSYMRCPITTQLIRDPVSCTCGHNFERSYLIEQVRKYQRCPVSSQTLAEMEVRENENLRLEIQRHVSAYQAATTQFGPPPAQQQMYAAPNMGVGAYGGGEGGGGAMPNLGQTPAPLPTAPPMSALQPKADPELI